MISLFPEPYRITINSPSAAGGSRVGLLQGLIQHESDLSLIGVVMLEDGMLTQLNTSFFSIDFRYDVEQDRWVDRNAQNSPEPTQE